MGEQLRVLMIEDSESDAGLLLRGIEKAGFSVRSRRVETAGEMRSALSEQDWDLITADYHLPEFDAPTALQVLQETGKDIPFLVISGAVGEEAAVALMRQGAKDYLMKDSMGRLGPVIRRELADAGNRRERRQAEDLIRLQSSALNAAANAIVILDHDGRIEWANPAFSAMTGYALEQVAGKTTHDLESAGIRIGIINPSIQDVLRAEKVYHGELTSTRGDGQAYIEEITITTLPGLDGQETKYIAIIQDITHRKRLERAILDERATLANRVEERTAELRLANAELVRANRIKDEFLANMSHELRTPLNGILTMSESIEEEVYGPVNDRQRKALHTIHASGSHLLVLINDILDLSKVESGKLETNLEAIEANSVCLSSLAFVKQLAQKKSITVQYQEPEQPIRFVADELRMKQILVNLLSNAVKFTPEGGRVSLKIYSDPVHHAILFTVHDTGKGISAEDQARLFQPFTQLDSGLNRMNEGTGLGLALSKRLAELQGGSISVQSQVGAGSSFTLSLPWDPRGGKFERPSPGGKNAPAGDEPQQYSGTVLLADDNEANLFSVCDYLEHLGFEVKVARNGLEALALAREVLPDVILLDIQMPVMDGLEAARQLRADPRFRETPIIALTALAMKGDLQRCLEAGATDYLSKPFHLRDLKDLLARFRRGDY